MAIGRTKDEEPGTMDRYYTNPKSAVASERTTPGVKANLAALTASMTAVF
jgi:hypothetical protein